MTFFCYVLFISNLSKSKKTPHLFCLDIHGEVLVVLLDYLLLYGFTLCNAILAQEWL